MQVTRFTGELARLRTQELVRRAEQYHQLDRERREREEESTEQGSGLVLRRALVAFGLSLIMLVVTAGIAFAGSPGSALERKDTPAGAAQARTGLDLGPAILSVVVLMGVAVGAELHRHLKRSA